MHILNTINDLTKEFAKGNITLNDLWTLINHTTQPSETTPYNPPKPPRKPKKLQKA